MPTRLNALELDNVLKAAGWTDPTDRRIGWALAMRESSGYFDIKGGPNPNGTYDYGLFQINEIHKNNPNVQWSGILTAAENAKFAFYLTQNGHNFSAWGLPNDDGTITGYAASLKKNDPATYQLYYDRWKKFYDSYPSAIAESVALATTGVVSISNLIYGKRNADVQEYQMALRNFLRRSGRNPDQWNPAGATGYYGTETIALTQRVFAVLAYRKVLVYPSLDTRPNAALLKAVGLKVA